MKYFIFVILVCLLAAPSAVQSDDTKVSGRLFSYWGMDLTDGSASANEFGLGRAYLTIKSQLSDFTSLRITTDLRQTEDADGNTQYNIILKYGYIDWRPPFGKNSLNIRFGLQPTPYIDYQNKLWGRRYLSKTVADINKYLTSSDLGVSANVALGKDGALGQISAALFNGTSYSKLGEKNSQKDFNAYGRLNPFWKNDDFIRTAIVAQFYYGTQNIIISNLVEASDYRRQLISVGGLLAYRNTFDMGFDLNWYTLGQGPLANDFSQSGLSIHGTLYFMDMTDENSLLHTLNIFARIDLNDPNANLADDGNNYLIAGIEIVPTEGFKTSLNIRSRSFEDPLTTSEKELFVNSLLKF
ncbi:MAG: hypothetical protein IIC66_03710 [candidate division Zixibacteria bacterium]|nr:hypothetical protein [candidate division Zixibacteria bacterium]